jgi:hypothetical protein
LLSAHTKRPLVFVPGVNTITISLVVLESIE